MIFSISFLQNTNQKRESMRERKSKLIPWNSYHHPLKLIIIPWSFLSLSLSLIQKTISITSFIATLLYLHVLLLPSYKLGGFWRERHVVTPVIAPRVTFHLWRITVQARTWGFSCQMFVVLQNLAMFQWERKVHGIYTGDFNYFVYHCIEFNSRFGLIVNNKHEE